MQKLRFSIFINAPREKVWKVMLEDATYRQWTEAFGPGSHYVGDWQRGSKILFLGPGDGGGMIGRIAENKPFEFISIEYLGIVENGREDTSSAASKDWAGAHEDYTLEPRDGGTQLDIEVDTLDEFKDMFGESWPKALQKLKELAEA